MLKSKKLPTQTLNSQMKSYIYHLKAYLLCYKLVLVQSEYKELQMKFDTLLTVVSTELESIQSRAMATFIA